MTKAFNNTPKDINLHALEGKKIDRVFNKVYECSDHLDERTRKELEKDNDNKPSPCWFVDSKSNLAYSRVHINGKQLYIHRLFFKLFYPHINLYNNFIDHKCRSTGVFLKGTGTGCCVNPSHLEAMSQSENTLLVFSRQKLDSEYVPDQFNKFEIDSSGFNFEDLPKEDLFSLEPDQTVLETDRERYKGILFCESVTDDFLIDTGEFRDVFDEL